MSPAGFGAPAPLQKPSAPAWNSKWLQELEQVTAVAEGQPKHCWQTGSRGDRRPLYKAAGAEDWRPHDIEWILPPTAYCRGITHLHVRQGCDACPLTQLLHLPLLEVSHPSSTAHSMTTILCVPILCVSWSPADCTLQGCLQASSATVGNGRQGERTAPLSLP